jgi:iron complex transport system substrate-binding protein
VAPQDGFENLVDTLKPDIPVIALSYNTPEQVMESIELLGRIFECENAAAEYIEFFQGTLNTITGRVVDIPEEEKTKVYYEIMAYYTFGTGHPVFHNQITIPGGVNIAADLPQAYGAIDPEWVMEANPDVIIAMGMNYSMKGSPAVACGYDVDDPSGIQAFRETILSRSELSDVSAVKTGRVYIMQKELNTLSVIGFAYIAKWLYPELFEDLNPEALHQEYLTRFLRTNYNLDEHGVFVYPEL